MVYTEHAPRRQQFHVAPAMQQPNRAVSIPFPWIKIAPSKKKKKIYSHSLKVAYDYSSIGAARKQIIVLYIETINQAMLGAFKKHFPPSLPPSLAPSHLLSFPPSLTLFMATVKINVPFPMRPTMKIKPNTTGTAMASL